MKKKLAMLLALCLTLGILPLSALAAQYKGTLNGKEITIDVNDETGAVTLPSDLTAYYSVSPETLTVGTFPASQEFTLTAYYGESPKTVTVTGLLVTEPAAKTFTVSFAAGEHASGTKDSVTLTVPAGETEAEYTLPNAEGFTPESGYVFTGWLVGSEKDAKEAGTKITVNADVTLTATWAVDETILVAKPSVSNGAATVDSLDVTAKTEAVILDLQGNTANGAAVTIKTDIVAKVQGNGVKTVEVKTALASVTVPAAALPTGKDAVLTVGKAQKPGGTPVTVTASVRVTLTGVTENTVLTAPIRITLDAAGAPANALLAYWNTARSTYVRARGSIAGGKATFLTRHLTDFAVVSEAEPEVLEVSGSGRSATAKVEPGETGLFVFTVKDGDGERSVVSAASARSSSGEQVTVRGETSESSATLDKAYALQRVSDDPILTDGGALNIAPNDIMAEKTK